MRQQGQALEKMGVPRVVASSAGASFEAADADRTMRGQCLAENLDPRSAAAKETGGLELRHRAAANVVIQDLTPIR